jgi:hypothetical protein
MTQPAPVRIDCLKAIHRAQFAHRSGPGPVPRGETSMRGTGKPSLTMGLALASSFLILAPAAAVAQSITIPLPFIGPPHFGPTYRAPAPSHRSSSGSSSHDSSSSSSSSSTPEKDATQEEGASNGGSHSTTAPNTTRSQTSEATPSPSSSSSANHSANDAPAFAPSR